MAFPVETIPDEDSVYYRVHKCYFENGVLLPNVFRDIKGGMSVAWSKYSTAEVLLNLAQNPADNGVISFHVRDIRNLKTLSVIHKPSSRLRAHSEIIGEKTPKIRVHLLRLLEWENNLVFS